VGFGIPEIEAKKYEGKIAGGNILLAVHVDDRAEQSRVRDILKRGGAEDISTTGEVSTPKRVETTRTAN
jgi:hypothetical protein